MDEGGFHWVEIRGTNRHLSARDRDNLVTPSQCDTCVFWNLQGRNPGPHELLMECIRQANLDTLRWRETATVSSTLRTVTQMVKAL
jgi:hypothetical protein